MKTKIIFLAVAIFFSFNNCFSQPGNGGTKPPTIEERQKMVDEKVIKPLHLDNSQNDKVAAAFKDFFLAMDKLVDKSTNPPARPEKSKIDALAKIRDDKVKEAIPETVYTKYLELEKNSRPKDPPQDRRVENK